MNLSDYDITALSSSGPIMSMFHYDLSSLSRFPVLRAV